MNKLYLECYSGISGDMAAGALIDLGVDKDYLFQQLKLLDLSGFSVHIDRTQKQGMEATSFTVVLDREKAHTPSTEAHVHEEHNHDGHAHTHDHSHYHREGEHHHGGRTFSQIRALIEASHLSEKAKRIAIRIFRVIAEAEGQVHGQPPEEVAFQEVGAVDSIVDIVTVGICLDYLQIDQVIASALYEGTGFTRCSHGLTPVPAPSTLRIIQSAGIPMKVTQNPGEMVTPTGAAIVAALSQSFHLPPSFTIEKIGIGAGKKDFKHPNVVRAMLIDDHLEQTEDEICVLQSAIDDSTPEQLAYCQNKLLENGAVDAYFSSIYMKKNRPAYHMTVLCRPQDEQRMTEIIFRETTAIGLRKAVAKRNIMTRKITPISILGSQIDCKICTYNDIKKYYVEYESAAMAAQKANVSLEEVYRKVYAEINKMQER